MTESVAERQHVVNLGAEVRTPTGEALSHFSFQVLRLANLLSDVGDALTQPSGQSTARWQVLAAVVEQPLTVAQIARRLGLTRQGVQRVADLLAHEHSVRYQDNPAHRRARLLVLTTAGRTALLDIEARQRQWANRVGADLDAQELRQATVLVQRVQQALSAEDEA
jgi:DNA-binding MarR family transcriptional regulator